MRASRARSPRGAKNGVARYRIDAITKAVRLLRQFSRAKPRLSANELARSSRLSRPLAERTLLTLQHNGLIRRADDGYELGLGWLRLADVRRRQVGMRQLALPVMRRLRDTLNETVILAIRAGSRRVNIDYVESTQAIRRTAQSGFEAPLHIGAAGRTLMSGLSPTELDDYFAAVPLMTFDGKTAVSRATIVDLLDRLRGQGFSVSLREITPDTAAVSAPIHDHTGGVVGALTISSPVDRFTPALERACISQVTKGAAEVSRTLGFNPGGDTRPSQ
jgi:DNA-binding IclR family transcriptional regulator